MHQRLDLLVGVPKDTGVPTSSDEADALQVGAERLLPSFGRVTSPIQAKAKLAENPLAVILILLG